MFICVDSIIIGKNSASNFLRSKVEPSKMEEEGEDWQTPKNKCIAIQSSILGRPMNGVSSENSFSPSARRSEVSVGEADSQKEERTPTIYIKNLTNINALLIQIQNVNQGVYFHTCNQTG